MHLYHFNLSLFADYPKYYQIRERERLAIQAKGAGGSYLDDFFTSHMKAERPGAKADVHSVLEIGSRDAVDALKLSEYYQCHIFAFECNPEAISICRNNINQNPNVTLVPLAVWNKTGPITFYPIIKNKAGYCNSGASSRFKVSREGHHKTFEQKEITVQSVRLDEWLESQRISSIDLLCIDAQGAEYQILEGMGKYLSTVKYIITELEHTEIYKGEVLYADVEKFLESKGFKMYVGRINAFFGDYLFVRKDILRSWWGNDWGV